MVWFIYSQLLLRFDSSSEIYEKQSTTSMGSRLIFFSLKHRLPHSLNLIPRIGQSRRIQSSSSTNYSKPRNGQKNLQTVKSAETQSRPSWSWTSFAIPGVILGFAGLASLIHYNDERRINLKGQRSIGVDTVKGPNIGGPFTLIDTENQTVSERDFLGNWVLLYFGYTSSPDVGPAQIQMIAKAVDKLESAHNIKVLPVFVTLDPQRDSPAQLRTYLKEFSPKIVGLAGPVGSIRQMAQEYRVFFKKVEEEGGDYLVESSHNMYLMNPKMEIARCFGIEYNAEELSEAILKETRKTVT